MKKFIVLEGLDGAGKSTQINLLTEFLKSRNMDYRYLHFPRTDDSSPVFGEMVANFLKGDYGPLDAVNPYLVALLYAGDRNNAKSMISEWLDKGYFVVLDRYVYSNMAFQCAKLHNREDAGKLEKWIDHLEYVHYGIPKPSLSIFLHMNFEFISKKLKNEREGDDRNYLQGKKDIHEADLSFQQSVEKEYMHLVNVNEDFHSIDCYDKNGETLEPLKIHEKIIDLLKARDII